MPAKLPTRSSKAASTLALVDETAAAPALLSERALFELVYRHMRTLAGAGAPDLDDLVQTAAEQILRARSSFEGRSELTTWIYAVCYRVLLQQRRWYRRWALRFSLDQDDREETANPAATPAALVEARERALCLRRNLARMSDKYRAVVVLCDFEELAVPDVAAIVAANERTVRSRLRDGRKQLARLLASDPTFSNLEPER